MEKQATFRFYEELNDFLPVKKRKVDIVYKFKGNPGIKDAIQANGGPHVEVDMILVNGQSVDFNYKLRDNDRVSVYPVFETLDISEVTHLRSKPLRVTKFILDVHLGKLAKYLRMCGFDTAYFNECDDMSIIRIALDEHRIILTCDKGILKVGKVTHAYYVRSRHPRQQFVEVLKHFDLYSSILPFSRCIKCNGELIITDKEKIIDALKPDTIRFFNSFLQCQQCGNIYWKGSHYESMVRFIEVVSLRNQ